MEYFCERDECKHIGKKIFSDYSECKKCNLDMARCTCVDCGKVIHYPIDQKRRPKYCKNCRDKLSNRYFFVKIVDTGNAGSQTSLEPSKNERQGHSFEGSPSDLYNPTYEQ